MPVCILSKLTLVKIQLINEQEKMSLGEKHHMITRAVRQKGKIFQPINNADKNICLQLIWFLERQSSKFVSFYTNINKQQKFFEDKSQFFSI